MSYTKQYGNMSISVKQPAASGTHDNYAAKESYEKKRLQEVQRRREEVEGELKEKQKALEEKEKRLYDSVNVAKSVGRLVKDNLQTTQKRVKPDIEDPNARAQEILKYADEGKSIWETLGSLIKGDQESARQQQEERRTAALQNDVDNPNARSQVILDHLEADGISREEIQALQKELDALKAEEEKLQSQYFELDVLASKTAQDANLWEDLQQVPSLLARANGEYADGQPVTALQKREAERMLKILRSQVEDYGDEWDRILAYINMQYNQERMASMTESAEKLGEETPALAWLGKRATGLAAGAGTAELLRHGLQNLKNGGLTDYKSYIPLDTNALGFQAAKVGKALDQGRYHYTEELYQDLAEQPDAPGGWNPQKQMAEMMLSSPEFCGGKPLYQWLDESLSGVADSVLRTQVGGLLGSGIGLSGQAKAAFTDQFSSVVSQSADVVGNIVENKEKGLNDSQAVACGIMSGIVCDVLKEKGAASLWDTGVRKAMSGKLVKNTMESALTSDLGKKLVTKGMETALGNTINRVSDVLIRQGKGNVAADYQEYVRQGMDSGQAINSLLQKYMDRDLAAVLTGGLMSLGKYWVKSWEKTEWPKLRQDSRKKETQQNLPMVPVISPASDQPRRQA